MKFEFDRGEVPEECDVTWKAHHVEERPVGEHGFERVFVFSPDNDAPAQGKSAVRETTVINILPYDGADALGSPSKVVVPDNARAHLPA